MKEKIIEIVGFNMEHEMAELIAQQVIELFADNGTMNIIKSNRIVSDKTFATRFVSFLKDIQVNDPMSEEELGYFRSVAHSLLLHQANTCTEKEELNYLHRCHPNGI